MVPCPACPAGQRRGGNGAAEFMQKSYLEFALDDLACERFCADCWRLLSANSKPESPATVPDEDWPPVSPGSQEEQPF